METDLAMTGFIIRRLGQAIVVVLGVTIITFVLLHCAPGQPRPRHPRQPGLTSGDRAFNKQNGLDTPLWNQYWLFLDKLMHGNLGYSYQYNRLGRLAAGDRAARDLVLGGLALIFSLAIAIPVGVAQAVRRNGALDYAGTGVSFVLYSMPQYAIALLLIQFLAISSTCSRPRRRSPPRRWGCSSTRPGWCSRWPV